MITRRTLLYNAVVAATAAVAGQASGTRTVWFDLPVVTFDCGSTDWTSHCIIIQTRFHEKDFYHDYLESTP